MKKIKLNKNYLFFFKYNKIAVRFIREYCEKSVPQNCLNVRNKKFYKIFYFQIIPIFILGFSVGVISIWPGIISGNSRKCFFNILVDGSDGSLRVGTLISINSNYLLKIKNTKNKYLKILFIGDSCFRKFK